MKVDRDFLWIIGIDAYRYPRVAGSKLPEQFARDLLATGCLVWVLIGAEDADGDLADAAGVPQALRTSVWVAGYGSAKLAVGLNAMTDPEIGLFQVNDPTGCEHSSAHQFGGRDAGFVLHLLEQAHGSHAARCLGSGLRVPYSGPKGDE